MKKLWIILLALACCMGSALAEGIPQAVLDARASVVYIEVYREQGGELLRTGSGFALGEPGQPAAYIVTNDHVGGEEGTACTVFYGAYDEATATCCYTLPERDLCILKLEEPAEGLAPLALSADPPQAGEKVYALGFPGSASDLFARGDDTAGDVTMTDGIISAVRRMRYVESGPDIMALQINAALSAGNSGGPLVNEQGAVVGVNTFGSSTDLNMNGAVAVQELLDSLKDRGIAYRTQSAGAGENTGGWWIAAVAALLAALGAAAGVLLVVRLRRRDGGVRTSRRDPPLADYLAKSGPMNLDMALYLLGGALQKTAALEAAGGVLPKLGEENLRVSAASGRAYLLSRSTRQVGAPAPEQLRGSATGGWTVVYQAGALLYHALSGRPLPHPMSRYENDGETKRTLEQLPLDAAQRAALDKALQLKPAERYTTMEGLLQALELGSPAAFASPAPQRLPKTHRPVNKKRLAKILGSSCLLAAFAGMAGFYMVKSDQRSQAVACLQRYDFEEAADLLQGVPALIKGDVAQLRALAGAGLLLNQGEYEQALAQLERLGSFLVAPELLEQTKERIAERDYRNMMDEAGALIQRGDLQQAKERVDTFLYGPEAERDMEHPLVAAERVTAAQYDLACLYAQHGAYSQAVSLFEVLGDYADSQLQLQGALTGYATELMEKDDLMKAYAVLKEYRSMPEVKTVWDAVIDGIYKKAVTYYNQGNSTKALQYFAKTGSYKETKKYVKILSTNDVFELLDYLGDAGAEKQIYSHYMMQDFLEGTWKGDGHYFIMESDGYISYDLPWFDYGDFYGIRDGTFYLYREGHEEDARDLFTIEIESRNVIHIYAHKNGKTYRMTRR